MSDFTWFFICVGIGLSLFGLATGFVLRATTAPLWAKLTIPTLIVSMAGVAPYSIKPMMGRPVETTMEQLPRQVVLLAFYPINRLMVDIWIVEGKHTRIYQVPYDRALQKALTQAREELKDGPTEISRQDAEGAEGPDGGGSGSTVGSASGGTDQQSAEDNRSGEGNKHTSMYLVKKHTLPGKAANGGVEKIPLE